MARQNVSPWRPGREGNRWYHMVIAPAAPHIARSTRLDSYVRWTMMAMIGMTGVIAALIKL